MNPRAVARGWWLMALTAVLAVVAAYLYSMSVPDRFQARGTYVIGPSDTLEEPETIVRSFDSLQGQGIVPTLVELLSSSTIAEEVGATFGLDRAALDAYELRASVLSSSNTLELSATGPDARLTAELARGVGARASAVFEDLYSVYDIRPLDLPSTPEQRFSPQPGRNMVLALMLGLTAGFGLALLRARFIEVPVEADPDEPVEPPHSGSNDTPAAGTLAAPRANDPEKPPTVAATPTPAEVPAPAVTTATPAPAGPTAASAPTATPAPAAEAGAASLPAESGRLTLHTTTIGRPSPVGFPPLADVPVRRRSTGDDEPV